MYARRREKPSLAVYFGFQALPGKHKVIFPGMLRKDRLFDAGAEVVFMRKLRRRLKTTSRG